MRLTKYVRFGVEVSVAASFTAGGAEVVLADAVVKERRKNWFIVDTRGGPRGLRNESMGFMEAIVKNCAVE